MTKPLRIAIAGLGTVGGGVLRLLTENAALLQQRCGRPLEVVAVSARDRARDRGTPTGHLRWSEDPVALAADPDVDLVVELIGGSEGPARALVEAAIARGKPVVTANKALLAHHGTALATAAEAAGVPLLWEAAVAGGIPAIKAIREGLSGNAIAQVSGILNGTCNYILTEMLETKRDFAEVLAEAQRLGFAEADPSFDIDGIDTAHKLALLTALAFGAQPDFRAVKVSGIRHVSALDIEYAQELGYRIKLLGVARRTPHGIDQRVEAVMVPRAAPLAQVSGVFNAVVVQGNASDRIVLQGRGAGAGPTASAVVADIVDIARSRALPVFGIPATALGTSAPAPESPESAYYLRLMVVDKPGVVADIASALRDARISIESLLQRGRSPGEAVPVVLTTHATTEAALRQALEAIAAQKSVLEQPRFIRIEAD